MPEIKETTKLQLRKADRIAPMIPPPVAGGQGLPAPTPVADARRPDLAPPSRRVPMPVRTETDTSPVKSVLMSWVVFLLSSSCLVGLQVLGRADANAVWWYLFLTYLLSLVLYSVIVIKAFFDTLWQGILMLGIPTTIWISFVVLAKEATTPWLVLWGIAMVSWLYIPFYVFFKSKRAPVLKGTFGALLLASMLEWPVLGDRSLVGRFIGDISDVSSAIMPAE